MNGNGLSVLNYFNLPYHYKPKQRVNLELWSYNYVKVFIIQPYTNELRHSSDKTTSETDRYVQNELVGFV